MWVLPLPNNNDSREILDTALTYKDGTPKHQLNDDEYQIIESIYEKYEEQNGKHHDHFLTNTLSDATKNALHDGYNEVQEDKRLSQYRARLLLAAERCPLCSISDADQLDHYLPRSIYKSLALYSSNLVPTCGKCNNKKRTATGTVPSNTFIHAYYDKVPTNERFLIASTNLINSKLKVSFEIIKTQNLNDNLFEMMKFQISKINFNDRILKEMNIFLSSYYTSMETAYSRASDPEDVKKLLLKEEKHFNTRMGINDWRSSLLNSLANNVVFCNGGFILALGITT